MLLVRMGEGRTERRKPGDPLRRESQPLLRDKASVRGLRDVSLAGNPVSRKTLGSMSTEVTMERNIKEKPQLLPIKRRRRKNRVVEEDRSINGLRRLPRREKTRVCGPL
jgi:hypothetical protein